VTEDLAVGPARPSDLARGLDALSTAPSARPRPRPGRDAEALPRPRRSSAPPASRRWRCQPDARGATAVHLAVRVTPAGIAASAPVQRLPEKYAGRSGRPSSSPTPGAPPGGPSRRPTTCGRSACACGTGASFPSEGPPDPPPPLPPPSTGDYATQMGRFKVGAARVVADLALTRTPGEKGLSAGFSRSPTGTAVLGRRFLDDSPPLPFEAPAGDRVGGPEAPGGTLTDRSLPRRVRET